MNKHATTWPWIASAVFVCVAAVLSFVLRDSFAAAKVDWLPERAHVNGHEVGVWKSIPAQAVEGWLPRSRWDATPAFDVRRCKAEPGGILDTGPAPDDIPALDEPPMLTADKASWLKAEDEVIGLASGADARCYPVSVMRWHCVVNGSSGGRAVTVLFDPLSGASLALSRRVEDQALSFGVSGKAYKGAALLYDRETRSLWHPLSGECIAGPLAGGGTLRPVPVELTTWAAWRKAHPATLVLSRNTGFGRAYDVDPYAAAPLGPGGKRVNYWADLNLVLAPPTEKLPDLGLAPKTLVLGVAVGEGYAAFVPPARSSAPVRLETTVLGRKLVVSWDPRVESRCFRAVGPPSSPALPNVTCYWFAWQAAHPDTMLVKLGGPEGPSGPAL